MAAIGRLPRHLQLKTFAWRHTAHPTHNIMEQGTEGGKPTFLFLALTTGRPYCLSLCDSAPCVIGSTSNRLLATTANAKMKILL